jgi:hypothetical protein
MADNLATQSLSLSVQHKEVNLPNNIVSLYIKNKLVSSNHSKHLRDAYLSIPVRKHINQMNNWTNNEFDIVWWDTHEKAMKKFSNNPLLMLQKYVNNRLPTNRRESRYYKYIAEGCHVCNETESQAHIIQCRACELRNTARTQYISDIKSFMHQTYLSIDTINVISTCLQAWLSQEDTPSIEILGIEYNDILSRAYYEQSQLGWENWFKGRITTAWREVYMNDVNTYIHHVPNGPRIMDAEQWGTKIIVKTWDFVRSSWKIRNDGEHDNNGDPLRKQKEKLIRKILWCKTQINTFPNNYLRNLTAESLQGLPLENLKMTDSQFQILMRDRGIGQYNEEDEILSGD